MVKITYNPRYSGSLHFHSDPENCNDARPCGGDPTIGIGADAVILFMRARDGYIRTWVGVGILSIKQSLIFTSNKI